MIRKVALLLFVCGSVALANFSNDDPDLELAVVESIPLGVDLHQNESIVNSLLTLVNRAKQNVSIAAFYADLTSGTPSNGGQPGMDLFNALVSAVKRGVSVRLAITSSSSEFPSTDAYKLAANGVQVRFLDFQKILGPTGGVLHTKLYVADANEFVVCSANLDWRSFTQVKELGLHGWNSTSTAQQVSQVFETYWTIGATNSTPSTWPKSLDALFNWANPIKTTINGSSTSTNLVVSQSPPAFEPPNWQDDLASFLKVVYGSGESLDMEVMDYFPAMIYVDPKTYWSALDDAIRTTSYNNQTYVRFLIGYWNHTEDIMIDFVRSLDALPNIEVRLFEVPPFNPPVPYTRVNHAKWAVTSNHLYVTTSNWAQDYYTNTAGASITSDSADLIAIGKSIFERDWNSQYTHPLPSPSRI